MPNTLKESQKREVDSPDKSERTRTRRVYTPLVDIIERKDDIMVNADMPGVNETSVDINLEKNVLSIYGKVEAEIPENHRLFISEYGVGDYQRSFTLTDEVDRDGIRATIKNGLLTLILPKATTVKSRKISVKAEA